ncbi:MAG: hypothetical protein QOK31_320 [Solirubrobacteraceae bacterium]|nr:hypothetical protein [Solirubrobacteraceae bacterium]
MRFWAEGSKSRNRVKLVNSDAHMIRFFLRFLTEGFGVKKERCSLSINVYTGNGLSIEDIEAYWLD